MHIIIKEKDGDSINIGIPNFMMNVGIKIALKSIKYDNSTKGNIHDFLDGIDKKYVKMAIKDLKKYKGLEIVNIDSKNGDCVRITI